MLFLILSLRQPLLIHALLVTHRYIRTSVIRAVTFVTHSTSGHHCFNPVWFSHFGHVLCFQSRSLLCTQDVFDNGGWVCLVLVARSRDYPWGGLDSLSCAVPQWDCGGCAILYDLLTKYILVLTFYVPGRSPMAWSRFKDISITFCGGRECYCVLG